MRLGVDIGGTKTAALVLDPVGEVVAHVTAASGRGRDDVLATAVGVAARAADVVGGWTALRHVGVCMPGLVDPVTGWARSAVHLDVDALDLAGEVAAATGHRPGVDNDVKAAALGAVHVTHAGAPSGRTAYLNAGTGLAAALVDEGRVLRGAGGAAGEIGHLPVGTEVPCSCGQRGCLETIASGSALHRLWPRRPAELFPAAAQGDPVARDVVATLARGLGLAVQVLVTTGADLVLVGGGLARDRAELEAAVRDELVAHCRTSPFLARLDLAARVRVLDGAAPLAAIGAALLPTPVTA
ncbi:ROK family protein [Phycicoccus sonneratiae]|uniref:ROK family protein n=1 Tax=Phycicoccus sonneratiae TaxID=2807628 RepID=A0ABS2CLA3_9MICO|nr:ROK family protein [Phycicoccus sonneraticus]MBM6399849.1 ROK family protein [Phycicoccus sonneraticus]